MSIGWGPNADDDHSCWERPDIVGFVMRNGPPRKIGPQVTPEHIKDWLAHDRTPPNCQTRMINRLGITPEGMAILRLARHGKPDEGPKLRRNED